MENITIQEELNEKIKQVLRAQNKTIKWLAAALNMNASSLYTILNRKGNKIDMALYGRLLEPLNLNVSELLKITSDIDETVYFNGFVSRFKLSEKQENGKFILFDLETSNKYVLTETEKAFLIFQLKKIDREYILKFIDDNIKPFND